MILYTFGSVSAVATDAKTNRGILSGSDWLAGNGVDVYSNDGSFDSADNDKNYVNIGTAEHANIVLSGLRWQCVELVNRLYLSRGWINTTWQGNGFQMYDKAPTNLSKDPKGSITEVAPGDVIVLNNNGNGHVAIVDSIDDQSETKAIVHTVSQNLTTNSDDTRRDFVWDKANKTIKPWSGFTFTGIVHAPDGGASSNGPLRVTQSLSMSSADLHMYQPVSFSYRIKNTSLEDVWIWRLVVAIRGPGENPLDLECGNQIILGVGQEFTCSLNLQQGYGQQGTYMYWADWEDWGEYWHTGDLGQKKTFTVGPPYTLTAVQPVSVGPSDRVAMYSSLHWSYRVRNTSGAAASIQRLIVAVRGPSGSNLDTTCASGNGVTLQANQEWTCDVALSQGYGQSGTYTFWADWQDWNNVWHAGQLGSARTLVVTQAPTLSTIGALSVGPSDRLAMYQPLRWSYRVKNTSGAWVSIQKLVVAVRTPDGSPMDVVCDNGVGVTLAPAQEWTCEATYPYGYGSQGTFTFWADWQGYDGAWHAGALGSMLTLHVGPPNSLSSTRPITINPARVVAASTAVDFHYQVRNTSGVAASVQRFVVAVRGPNGQVLDVPCSNGSAVGLTVGGTFDCDAVVTSGYAIPGVYTYWADWLDYNGLWHAGQLSLPTSLTVTS